MGIMDAVILRLDALCRERGITNNKMCTNAAVPQSTINNSVNGKTKNMGIVTLKKLIDSFDMTITDFFDDDLFRNLEQEIK